MDFSSLSISLTPVYQLATAVVTAGAGIYAVRKVVKLINKS